MRSIALESIYLPTNSTLLPIMDKELKETEPTTEPVEEETTNENNDEKTPADDDDALDTSIKHPLHATWTMWYNPASSRSSSKAWTNNVREIWSFSTVEDFWRLFNNLVPPSRLPCGSNYHMFKKGVQPEWEDPANTNGGKWLVILPNKGEEAGKKFDEAWMWIVLALIGEFFDDSDFISGVVISPRAKNNRIALWTTIAKNEEVVKRIGSIFKQNLNIEGNLGFQCHVDAMKSNSYRNQPMYQV